MDHSDTVNEDQVNVIAASMMSHFGSSLNQLPQRTHMYICKDRVQDAAVFQLSRWCELAAGNIATARHQEDSDFCAWKVGAMRMYRSSKQRS